MEVFVTELIKNLRFLILETLNNSENLPPESLGFCVVLKLVIKDFKDPPPVYSAAMDHIHMLQETLLAKPLGAGIKEANKVNDLVKGV